MNLSLSADVRLIPTTNEESVIEVCGVKDWDGVLPWLEAREVIHITNSESVDMGHNHDVCG